MRARYLLFTVAGLTLTLFGAGAVRAEPAGRVRLVFISDSNDARCGHAYRQNAAMTGDLFREANELDPARPYDKPVMVQGDGLTNAAVLRAIAQLPLKAGVDTIAVFYWGHGASDVRRNHFFTMRSGQEVLMRRRLVNEIQARRPRLAVVLSDTCSSIHEFHLPPIVGAPPKRANWQALRALFLEQQGLLDVNACKPGQLSWNVKVQPAGEWVSLFTCALIDYLYSDKADQLKTPTAAADWPTLLRLAGTEANRMFVRYELANDPNCKRIGQKSQDPHAYSLPVADRKPAVAASVKFRPMEFLGVSGDPLQLRCGFEAAGMPGRSLAVYVALWLNSSTGLRGSNGRDLLWHWNTVTCPADGKAREWSDCRVSIPLSAIAGAANLPAGHQFDLFASCHVWDVAGKKWCGNGWDARLALRATRDKAGKVIRVAPQKEAVAPPEVRADCRLALKHLKPWGSVTVVCKRPDAPGTFPRVTFQRDGSAVPEVGPDLFESVDTPEKARELAELFLAGDLLVQTPDQYKALTAHFARDANFKVSEKAPPSYGLRVTGGRERGFVVHVLHYTPFGTAGLSGGCLYHAELTIAARAPIEARFTRCISNGWADGRPAMLPLTAIQARAANDAVARILRSGTTGGPEVLAAQLIVSRGP